MEGLSFRLVQKTTDRTSSAGLPTPALSLTVVRAHGVTTNNGDFNFAGRDVHVHKHYHSYPSPPFNVAISALSMVRNLRKIHLDILSKATPGTGIWLLKTDEFLLWLDANGKFKILWGTGIPGAGKTVLASIVIDALEAHAAAAGGTICVCYVYVRYSDGGDLTVQTTLEILVKQTLERHPHCIKLAEQVYGRHFRENTQPTEIELLQLLREPTGAVNVTFYVLDALDEAPYKLQLDLVRKLTSLNIRLFITSRPLKDVEARFPSAYSFSIMTQEQDLDLHISAEIQRSPSLEGLLEKAGPSLREEIVTSIKQKCGGMFLHASLQLDALCECLSLYEVRAILNAFPSRIEDTYLRTWARICNQSHNHASLAKVVLVWVINASRSMTMEELERAVATSPDIHKFEPDRLVPGSTLITLCCGLVCVEEESRLVRLVHYTAKITLEKLLYESFPHPHSLLAAVCISHLTGCGLQNTTISSEEEFRAALEKDPLLAYASEAWAFHARAGLDVEDTKCRTAEFIAEIHAFPAFTSPDRSWYLDVLTPLHVVALYHLPLALIEDTIMKNPNVRTKVHRQSALIVASRSGHEGLLEHLVTLPEIQVNMVDADGYSALVWAAYVGHDGIVGIPLAYPGIHVDLVDNDGWSILMLAARAGHQGVVKLLLSHFGTQVNFVDNEGWSALLLAVRYGFEGVAALLLAQPRVEVNLVNKKGWSALMLAARYGRTATVALLLAHSGVKVNLVEKGGWSALMLAARYGYEGVVKLLLAHPGIRVNLVNDIGSSTLMLASFSGATFIVKLLLAVNDMDVNVVDANGDTAVKLAAEGGHETVVGLLLAIPHIITNTKSSRDEHTALSIALAAGHEGIVHLLRNFELRNMGVMDPPSDFRKMRTNTNLKRGEDGSDSDSSELYFDAEEHLGAGVDGIVTDT